MTALLGKTLPDVSAEGIGWEWAVEYCARLREVTGKPFRLPSEAEWEYAARAGTTTPYEYGPVFTPDLVNNRRLFREGGVDQSSYGPVVGGISGPANAFGLKDMEGNVAEWVEDDYHSSYIGAPSDGSPWYDVNDPTGTSRRKARILRGGDYGNVPALLRSAARSHWELPFCASGTGFRVALTLPSE